MWPRLCLTYEKIGQIRTAHIEEVTKWPAQWVLPLKTTVEGLNTGICVDIDVDMDMDMN